MDNETQKVFNEGRALDDFTKSDGWRIVEDIFTQKIQDLQSIKNLTGTTPTQIVQDIKVRTTVVDVLMEILKDIKGRAEQFNGNQPLTQSDEKIVYQIPE